MESKNVAQNQYYKYIYIYIYIYAYIYIYIYIYYAHPASVTFEHSVCHESLTTT